MKNISRNFVSLSLALALFGGISGMAFAQEAEATEETPVVEVAEETPAEEVAEETSAEEVAEEATAEEVAEEAPAPTFWSAPSVTIGTGTFSIGVQTVYNGFLVTSDPTTAESSDTTIVENDGEDYTGKISFSVSYDNSDAPGVGYSFGVGGGIRRANNFGGSFDGYFDSPWGKLWLLNKQLTLRAGNPEDPWSAWDDNWSYGNDPGAGAVQLNINPAFLKGLNVGVTLPVPATASKADYPIKNLIVGFKLGEPLPYTTISAALKLRSGRYDDHIAAAEAAAKAATDAQTALGKAQGATTTAKTAYKADKTDTTKRSAYLEAVAAEAAAAKAKTDADTAKTAAEEQAALVEPLNESMDLNASIDFNLSPIRIRAEMQIAGLTEDLDDVPLTEIKSGTTSVTRDPYFQLHPRLDLSLSKLVDLGAFSLETFSVYAWIKSDPMYESDGDSNTKISVEWTPSYTLFDDKTNSIKASLFLAGHYDLWGGDPRATKTMLEDGYSKPDWDKTNLTYFKYNQIGVTIRPALQFNFGPNAGIRLRDQIDIMQTGVDPDKGIKNQVQVKFWWGF